ncbi:hypothetical protein E8E13_000334 [Curvularia kusanoi]|uniref:Uncharacterized protein n=1 Tax=Curvularia kusanoi TaxID=90978 RepID=A0A9P4T5N9_CURKU|nr:hypothetical protein E8E13_000334 [Curvularia kusanoi]
MPSLSQELAKHDSNINIDVRVCTLSASWNTGEVQRIDIAGTTLIQTASLPTQRSQEISPITFNLSDMGILNSVDFARELREGDALYLAGYLAAALAELPFHYDRYSGVITKNLTRFQEEGGDVNNMTTFKYTNTLYGYGFGVTTTSSSLSMAVMLIYCVITVLYLGYSFFTGLTSTAWSSAVEVVALALQSSKPSVLGDSSVGIDSIKTFSQGVGIRVNGDNELELVFTAQQKSN